MYKEKYTNSNILTKKLLKKFFGKIQKIVCPIKNELNNILEIGCGHGYSTYELSKIFNTTGLEASDLDPLLVQDAKLQNPDIKITNESVYNLNRDDASFDLVIILEVLEHLQFPDQALAELCRVSKKYCIISVPNEPLWRILNMARGSYWYEFGNSPGHVNHWSKAGINRLVSKHFKVLKVTTSIPWTLLLVRKY
jgi:2-polyprenyl-3-methyl-5-hydroxy-6-metoxy-1,4-benzoquinol methylase